MTWTTTEALADEVERRTGIDTDVACLDCGEALIVRYMDGEPVDEADMRCHCGGELEVV